MIGAVRDRWERAAAEHRVAVEAFSEATRTVPPDKWHAPLGPGRWSPAQVTEHVALSYEFLVAELAGGPSLRIRTGPVKRRLLRWFLLPHMLYHRTFPRSARSPREMLPGDVGVAQLDAAPRVSVAAALFERSLRADPRVRITHPFFGPVPARKALRFLAFHTEYHARQLANLAPADPS